MENYPLILTLVDVQNILRVGRNTVHELTKQGDFPAFKVGKQWRVPREAFFNWLNSRGA